MAWLQSSTGRLVIGVVLLGLALLAIVFIATTLGVEPRIAYLVALGVLGLAGVVFGIGQLRTARSASQLEAALRSQGLGATGTARPGQPSFDELRKQFDESLALLKQSRLGSGAIYKLPWFVIIGPPGSGKTTMLRESGLNFPYMTKGRAAIRGLGGTKNCDWWFADRGVLLDTAGRWTSEADDRDEWLAFLDLLKKYRRKQPVNGVVIAVSLDDVVYRSSAELQKLADDVRDRIDELTRRLQMLLPVYLVFTKCDGLIGFVESFSGMNREQRAQAWGFTFPEHLPSGFRFPEAFAQELDQLAGQLGKRRLPQLVAEPTRRRRRLMFRLPQEFAAARERLCQFAELIQQANPYQEASTIRGCYFTSGTQERGALGDLLSEMARKSGVSVEDLEIPSGERKCYFVDDVFDKVVFEDRDLATPTRAAGRRRRIYRWLQLGGIAVGAIVLLWLAIGRFLRVSSLTQRIEQCVAQSSDQNATKAERLAALRELHELAGLASAHEDVLASLRQRIARCASRELITPASEAITASYRDRPSQPAKENLAERVLEMGQARRDLDRRREDAEAALLGDQRPARFRPAVLDLLKQQQLAGEDLDATVGMFETLLEQYADVEQLWAPTRTRWQELSGALDEQAARQTEAERELLEQVEQDKGRLFESIAEAGKPIPLDRLACSALVAEGLRTTMLPKGSVTVVEGEVVLDFEDDVLSKATRLKEEILALPIAAELTQRRSTVLTGSLTTFREQVFPAWRELRWASLFEDLGLVEEIDRPEELVAARPQLLEEFARLALLYVHSDDRITRIRNRAQERMERVTKAFPPLAAAGSDLAALTKAIADLATAVQGAGQSSLADWSATAGGPQAAPIARGEASLFRSIVTRQVTYAQLQLRASYEELTSRYATIRERFPFAAEGDDCPLDEFFAFLDRLRGLQESCRDLPRIAREYLGDEQMFPAPPVKFLEFLDKAGSLVRRFGGEQHQVQISFFPYDANLQSILINRDGQTLFRTARMQPTRVVPAMIRADTQGALQVVLQTKAGESLSLANLDTQDRWLAKNKGPNGLPANYWGLFRLCRSGRPGDKQTFVVEQADPEHVAPVELKFKSDRSQLLQTLTLILSGTDAGEEQLFVRDSDAFRLEFPPFPWR